MEFLDEFFWEYDIVIYQLNLEFFKNLNLLDKIPFKKCVFLHLFNNECSKLIPIPLCLLDLKPKILISLKSTTIRLSLNL
jgi:hypothetical protein